MNHFLALVQSNFDHPLVPLGYTTDDGSGIAFRIGGLEVRYYGIFFALGLFISVVIGIAKLRLFYKVYYEPFFYFTFVALITILLGARMWSCIIGNSQWTEFFNFRNGGMAVEGGVMLTAIMAVIWFSIFTNLDRYHIKVTDKLGVVSSRKVSMWIYADAIIPLILFGQAIGRWGNFFNHEVYGPPVGTKILIVGYPQLYNGDKLKIPLTNPFYYYDPGTAYLWLKQLMPGVYSRMFIYTCVGEYGVLAFRVPLFLIESFFNIIFFALIYGVIDQIKGYHCGINAGLYFVYYGSFRAYLETLREKEFYFVTSVVTSIFFAVFGLIVILFAAMLAPRWRKIKIWYAVYIYLFFKLKSIMYFFVTDRSVSASKNKILSSKKNAKKTLVERKQIFLQNKINYGLAVKPSFIRKEVEMIYYYDARSMGPMFLVISDLFRKIFKRKN